MINGTLRVKSVPPLDVGLMGMEALETVIGYWEDALAAYNPTGNLPLQINIIISHLTIIKGLLNSVVAGMIFFGSGIRILLFSWFRILHEFFLTFITKILPSIRVL